MHPALQAAHQDNLATSRATRHRSCLEPGMKCISPSLPFEYFILDHVIPAGPVACTIGTVPVRERVTDNRGNVYQYAGLVRRDPDGRLDVSALNPGEWILEPNLIYRIMRD
jgi:hypothetical protein